MAAPLQTLPGPAVINEASDIVYLQQTSKPTKDVKASLAQIFVGPYLAVSNEVTARTTAVTNEANARISADAAEVTARNAAIAAEATARDAAISTAVSAAIALEASARNTAITATTAPATNFTQLTDVFPAAVVTSAANVQQQFRIIPRMRPDGSLVDATMNLEWSAANSLVSGWALTSASGTLGAAFVTALRTLWGIGAGATWPHTTLYGHLMTGLGIYPVQFTQAVGGATTFAFIGSPTLTRLDDAKIFLHIPAAT